MRSLIALACLASVATAQSPTAIISRVQQRRAEATRAVAAAVRAERELRTLPPRPGYVAVIADSTVSGAKVPGHDLTPSAPRAPQGPTALTLGVADLIATDLARIHALHPLERLRSQAIVAEQSLAGVDDLSRPRAWRLLGASDVVLVLADTLGDRLRLGAIVVHVPNGRVRATRFEIGTLSELFAAQRRLSLAVVRALGVEPTASEVRAIADRPAGNVNAFMAWTSAMEAIDAGDTPQAERLLRQALDMESDINAAFDASMVISATLNGSLANITPLPSGAALSSDDPSAEGLATEGNESEFGEAWLEVPGSKRQLRLYEATVPISTSMPIGRGRLDISTLWASSRADTPANDVFHAWGFTDVHVRFARPLVASGVSFSVGAALPSRDAHGADDDIRRVPVNPDLLPLAMYRRRNAPALSGGLFYATTAGAWNWGLGGGAEWTGSYHELTPALHTISVAPGMRWRLRVDAERQGASVRHVFGAAFTAFSASTLAGVKITGGERWLIRYAPRLQLGPYEEELGIWMLHTAPVRSSAGTVRPATSVIASHMLLRRAIAGLEVTLGLESRLMDTRGAKNHAFASGPSFSVARSIGQRVQAELAAQHIRGGLYDPAAEYVSATGWSLRAAVRYEP